MHYIIPVKRLTSFKMKLLCATVVCLGTLLLLTANITAENGSRSKRKVVDFNSQKTDANGNLDLEHEDVAHISSLRLAQVIWRHGDRTPIDRFPLDPYNERKFWPEGWGKLTKVGKQMQYRLGQYIRKRYDGYLSQTFVSEECFVQSSDKDRTIQSAMANLAGMWPSRVDELKEGEVQQFVPVHTISALLDNKIGFSKPCPRYDRLKSEVPTLPSEKSFDKENEKLYSFLTEHTGLKVTSYMNVSDIYDTLFVQKCHNMTLPTWTSTVFPEKLLPPTLKWLKAHTFNAEMLRLRAGPLVTDVVRNMKRVIEKPTEEELQILETLFQTPAAKFYVYSGHDTTISPMLDALGVFDGKIPPYAASVYFELHESDQPEPNNYYVKVFYRPDIQKPAVELPMKRCSSNPCKFEDFMKSVEPFILDEKQWEKECQ